MDNYNATLKALRNSIHMTRINQGADCELAYELETWTKILDSIIASAEPEKTLEEDINDPFGTGQFDYHAEYANREVHAIQARERE
jgi:hypothetical protein